MKKSILIFRIVTCILASLYATFAGFHLCREAWYKCMSIVPSDGGYALKPSGIVPEARPYIISAVALAVLLAMTVVFLFRRRRLAAVIAALAVITSAVCGMSLDTRLSEFTLWREIARLLGLNDAVATFVSGKAVLATVCIASAVCYLVLYMISCSKLSIKNRK